MIFHLPVQFSVSQKYNELSLILKYATAKNGYQDGVDLNNGIHKLNTRRTN
jgi:hypothetical protein